VKQVTTRVITPRSPEEVYEAALAERLGGKPDKEDPKP
jgi:hypothetical protein